MIVVEQSGKFIRQIFSFWFLVCCIFDVRHIWFHARWSPTHPLYDEKLAKNHFNLCNANKHLKTFSYIHTENLKVQFLPFSYSIWPDQVDFLWFQFKSFSSDKLHALHSRLRQNLSQAKNQKTPPMKIGPFSSMYK